MAIGAAAAALLLAGSMAGGGAEETEGAVREYVITAVELGGATTADQSFPPEEDPQGRSKGYGYTPPEQDSATFPGWEVSAYVWMPAMLLAFQGEAVALRTFVVGGDEHRVRVEGPDAEEILSETVLVRGRQYEFRFALASAGPYRLVCVLSCPVADHAAQGMTGTLIATPP